ncbi:MAG: helix-turn-helix transcriptional regulator [Verrucomicrobia bacterium]|nr:helix-turn-helix transcriptional regulator [Verrucomicrobiota bacterium]
MSVKVLPPGTGTTLKKKTGKVSRDPSVYDSSCPARLVIDHLADKWAVLIIGQLANGTMRFAALLRAIDGISQKMLTVTLRDLERDGLVSRKLYASVPPKVEYSLTALGASLSNKVEELCRWAEANMDQIVRARDNFDKKFFGN